MDHILELLEYTNELSDLRPTLLNHPDKEMTTRACLHYLGDDAQKWWDGKNNLNSSLDNIKKIEFIKRKLSCNIIACQTLLISEDFENNNELYVKTLKEEISNLQEGISLMNDLIKNSN